MDRTVIDAYVLFKSNPDNDEKKDTHFVQWAGISLKDLRKLKLKHKDWASKALKIRRESYAEKISGVDKALFTAATRGDTKAADLVYRRFDNWNPRLVEQTNNYYNFADLVKGLKKPRVVQKFRSLDGPDGEAQQG